ncbi:hypothetical protein ACQ4PT_027753 [Festuca glaucescens]
MEQRSLEAPPSLLNRGQSDGGHASARVGRISTLSDSSPIGNESGRSSNLAESGTAAVDATSLSSARSTGMWRSGGQSGGSERERRFWCRNAVQPDQESFANDSEGNVGGGYSPGANDGVYSEDGGYKAPEPEEDHNNTDNAFDGLHGEEAKIQSDDIDDDVSSQPAIPFVGMLFDHPDDAQKFYNGYAFKKGFGTRIAASRNSQRRGPPILIKRVFECVHSRKTVDNTKSECTSKSIASESTSGSKQAGVAMEVTDSRQRNNLCCAMTAKHT